MDAEIESFEKKSVNQSLYTQAADKAKKHGFPLPAMFIELMRIQKMIYLQMEGMHAYYTPLKANLAYFEMDSVMYAWEPPGRPLPAGW